MNTFLKLTTTALLLMPLVTNATEITNTKITSTGVKIVVDLDSNLKTGEKVKIDYGKGLKTMNCKNKSCSVTFTAAVLPKNTMKLDYKIGIYNNDVLLDGTLKNGIVDFVVSTPSSTTSTELSRYIKIANDGSELPNSAKLGITSKDWACTKDNKTGLIWEVKTSDGGLRDKYWNYSWYEPDANKNGGDIGQNGNDYRLTWCKGSNCDTYAFTNAVNTQSLCGANDWRMPTKYELLGIVKSDSMPIIDTTYFPDIKDNDWFWFWSSSINESDFAWYVNFDYRNSISNDYGNSLSTIKSLNANVRLVRNAQ